MRSVIKIYICLLEFYDFLGIKDSIINKIYKKTGKLLESTSEYFNIKDFLLEKIKTFHKSLYYDKRYQTFDLTGIIPLDLQCNSVKYISPWYFEFVLNRKVTLETCLYWYYYEGNFSMVKYLHKNNLYNGYCVFRYTNLTKSSHHFPICIFWTIQGGHLNIFKYLIELSINYEQSYNIKIREFCNYDNINSAFKIAISYG